MNVPVGYTYTNAIPQTKSVQQTAQTNSPAQYQTAPRYEFQNGHRRSSGQPRT